MGAQSLVAAICGSGCHKRSCPSLQSVFPSDNCSNATDALVCVPPVISQLPRHAVAQGHTCVGPAGPWHWMGANPPYQNLGAQQLADEGSVPHSRADTSCCSHHPPCSSLSCLSSCWDLWHGRVKGGSFKSPWSVASATHTAISRDWCDCPSGPVHSHGWSASSITSVLALLGAGTLLPVGKELWPHWSPESLQHCSLNIPSGAQPGMTLELSLGRVWRRATSESSSAGLLTPAAKAGRNTSTSFALGLTPITMPQSDNWYPEAPRGSLIETGPV